MKSICEYKLIQQTPMIHFQSREAGACLRASEVKSKLDKFIQQNVSNIPNNWFVNKEQSSALNYKIKILTDERVRGEEPDRNLYFGNMGKGPRKETVMYRKPISLKVVCFNPALMAAINEHLEAFFLLHNFGTRQNKGFGSFVLENTLRSRTADLLLAKYVKSSCNIYKVSYDSITDCPTIFKDIALFSGVLKSGYNQETYIKSFLVQHCLDKDKHGGKSIGGDKRWLKSPKTKLAPVVKKKATKLPQNVEVDLYRYNRALLGSAGNLAFINRLDDNDRPDRNAGKTNIRIAGKDKVKRIPSPVLYKVVGTTLYMIVRDHSDAVYGKRFQFSIKTRDNQRLTTQLQVPEKGEVDIQTVFADYVAEVNKVGSEYYTKLERKLQFLRQRKTIVQLGGEK